MKRNRLFFIFMMIPAVLLAAVVVITVGDLYSIRKTDPAGIYRELQAHLDRRIPTSFPLPDNIQSTDRSKTTVFVFGSSDIILSDGEVFPRYLERQHRDLRVVNFGVNGIDSFSIRQRVEEALAVATPDLIVLYYGHNDYNTAYNEFVLPNYFHKFHVLMRIPYLFHDKNKSFSRFSSEPFNYYWFYVINRPRLLHAFEELRLIDINAADYHAINRLILDYFIRNTSSILDMASAKSLPVILITPVANLRAEPIGDLKHTQALYRKGMETKDYRQSLAYLKAAKDTELFTFDLRAKTPLLEYLRTLSRRHVHILDLEKNLEELNFGFGNGDFVDYVHFNDRSHRLLAEIIYDFMKQNKLTGKRRLKSH